MHYVLLAAFMCACGSAFAATTTGSTYTAKLTLGKNGNRIVGGTLTVKGKGIDLYSLWNLSTVPTARGKSDTMSEVFGVFTSNGNVRLSFFSGFNLNGALTTNLNLVYVVRSSKGGTTATNATIIARTVKFKAVQGNAAKSTFTFVLTGSTVDTAVALLPKGGKRNLPTLAGCKAFTLQIGSALFAVDPDSKGNVKY